VLLIATDPILGRDIVLQRDLGGAGQMAIGRRELISALGGAAVTWPAAVRAQQPERVSRVGVLMAMAKSDQESVANVAAFRLGLQELGWREGGDLQIDIRWIAGDAKRIPTYTEELLNLAPDIVLAHGTPAVFAFKSKVTNLPIVFVQVADPIEQGIISNLSRPGGNITGFTGFEFSIAGKWLQILKEAAPRVTRVAMLFNPDTASYSPSYVRQAEAAATPLSMQVVGIPVHEPAQIEASVAAIGHEGNYGLIIIPDTFTLSNRELVVNSATQYRVPSIFPYRFYATSGGMISYGIDVTNLFYRAASYVDRVLKGASPGSLPVQQPTKYQLVVNLKTAKALGLTIPQALLATADEVIE
jgi:putative tryptophan/tyrosine transport system substrate-binding protein